MNTQKRRPYAFKSRKRQGEVRKRPGRNMKWGGFTCSEDATDMMLTTELFTVLT